MIRILQWPLESTRTPGRSCLYEVECEVDGRRYSARSRHEAPNELARVLVSAGVPDQPVEVRQVGIRGYLSWRSLHEMAPWSYEESAKVPLRRVRWKPPPDFTAASGRPVAQNRGETPAEVGGSPTRLFALQSANSYRRRTMAARTGSGAIEGGFPVRKTPTAALQILPIGTRPTSVPKRAVRLGAVHDDP